MKTNEYIWIVTINNISGRLIVRFVVVTDFYNKAIRKGAERFNQLFSNNVIKDIHAQRYTGDIVRLDL